MLPDTVEGAADCVSPAIVACRALAKSRLVGLAEFPAFVAAPVRLVEPTKVEDGTVEAESNSTALGPWAIAATVLVAAVPCELSGTEKRGDEAKPHAAVDGSASVAMGCDATGVPVLIAGFALAAATAAGRAAA